MLDFPERRLFHRLSSELHNIMMGIICIWSQVSDCDPLDLEQCIFMGRY
jgi:hypothetical protein